MRALHHGPLGQPDQRVAGERRAPDGDAAAVTQHAKVLALLVVHQDDGVPVAQDGTVRRGRVPLGGAHAVAAVRGALRLHLA